MSVEDARAAVVECAVLRAVRAYAEQEPVLSIPGLHEALDRLILEVKAEMPCYTGDTPCEWEVDDDSVWPHTHRKCLTCEARAELEKGR